MTNLLTELHRVVTEGKNAGRSPDTLRVQLKEVLHYFVLDCIYNSPYNVFVFYGGTCLRMLHDLPRLSEDIDFEVPEVTSLEKLPGLLSDYFQSSVPLTVRMKYNSEGSIVRTTLYFPVMYELGLSPHREETLRVKVETHMVSEAYRKELTPEFTPKFRYGKSFVVRHYDLPTLFASKLAAVLHRGDRGFSVGQPSEHITYKGRDFFDLIWYMEQQVQPNLTMLALVDLPQSIPEIFRDISGRIALMDVRGLYNDLLPLFPSQAFVKQFVATFKETFECLRKEHYS